jgi:hypothetical protein
MKFTSISRHQIYLIWCVAWFFLVLLLIEPISHPISRSAISLLIATICWGAFYLWWERATFRIGTLAIGAFFGMCLILPSRSIDTASLHTENIRSLQMKFETIEIDSIS